MKKNPSSHGNRKDLIRLKLPGISFVIITTARKTIMLTIILCAFILVFTLLVKGIRLV